LFGAQLLLYFEAVARIGAQQAVVLLHVYPMLVVFGERWARELPPFAVSGLVFLPAAVSPGARAGSGRARSASALWRANSWIRRR
jgi:hypothetical protein